jgi:5,6,7,8-tetrahydromethanopterin hydro-lyase
VNKATLAGPRHSELTWGAAQAGIAGGVMDAVVAGVIAESDVDALVLIAAVWVDPAADAADAVYRNHREATRRALVAGRELTPPLAEGIAAARTPWNPFFRAGA